MLFYDTRSRTPLVGNNPVAVGALPDMLTFTADGSRLLVANEGTPVTYGARIGTTVPRVYGNAAADPAGSVSIIDVHSRTLIASPGVQRRAAAGQQPAHQHRRDPVSRRGR